MAIAVGRGDRSARSRGLHAFASAVKGGLDIMVQLVVIDRCDTGFRHNNNVQRTVLVPWIEVFVRNRPEPAFGAVTLHRVANTTTSHHR